MDPTTATGLTPDLAPSGVMGSVQLSREQHSDIEFGWPLLRQIVELDVGQVIAVRERDVIAVAAAEGTESMIERAGALCRTRGWTLLASAKADHPPLSIGAAVIEALAKAGARCAALGTGRVRLVEKPTLIAAANRAKIAIVGVLEEDRD